MTAKAPSIANIRTLLRSGDSQRAERDARQLLAASPQNSELLYLLGCARLERGALDEAIALFERAASGAPAQAELLEAMASALLRRGDLDGAERHALLAQQAESTRSRPVNLLGLVALERGDIETALQTFARAVSLEIPNLEATTNMAVALNRSGDWRGAEEWSRSALKISPNHPAALINLGLALKAQRRLAEAREAFRRAGTDPRARFNLGYTQMLEGNLADGLPLLEARKPLLGIGRGLEKREWNGMAAPRKTLLVVHEQGLGDTLMMCRFWPQLLERFEHVVALVQPPLARLMAASFPGVEVVTSLEGDAERLYEGVYCQRGQAENLIKLHKAQLASDRTSCHSATANQVRLMLHTAAFWLMHTVRAAIPEGHALAKAEFNTLRLRLLKIAARVIERGHRIRVHLPTSCVEKILFRQIALGLSPSG